MKRNDLSKGNYFRITQVEIALNKFLNTERKNS